MLIRFLAALILMVAVTPVASGQAWQSPNLESPAAYLEAKARYDSLAKATPADAGKIVEVALKELEARARAIIGPVTIRGYATSFTLTGLPYDDPGGYVLDGLRANVGATEVIVSTAELIGGWARMHGGKAKNPLADLDEEDRLGWIFDDNVHVYRYADITTKAKLPPEVFLAKLVFRTNGDVLTPPDQLLVGIRAGSRVFLIVAPANAILDAPKACGAEVSDAPPYRKCFDEHVSAQAGFAKLVAQVRELAVEFSRLTK